MGLSDGSLARKKRASQTLQIVNEQRERIPFYPTAEDLRNLEAIKRMAGTNNNQSIRSGLKWFRWLLEQKDAGGTVQVVRENRVFELLTL